MAVFQFIEGFYNPSRRHSALRYLSPIEYERKHDGLSKPAQAPTRPSKPGNSSAEKFVTVVVPSRFTSIVTANPSVVLVVRTGIVPARRRTC